GRYQPRNRGNAQNQPAAGPPQERIGPELSSVRACGDAEGFRAWWGLRVDASAMIANVQLSAVRSCFQGSRPLHTTNGGLMLTKSSDGRTSAGPRRWVALGVVLVALGVAGCGSSSSSSPTTSSSSAAPAETKAPAEE